MIGGLSFEEEWLVGQPCPAHDVGGSAMYFPCCLCGYQWLCEVNHFIIGWPQASSRQPQQAQERNHLIWGGLEVYSLKKQVVTECTLCTNFRNFPVSLCVGILQCPLLRRIYIPGNQKQQAVTSSLYSGMVQFTCKTETENHNRRKEVVSWLTRVAR